MSTITQKPDRNFRSIADTSHVSISDETITPEDPQNYDDILKFSNAQDCKVIMCDINPHGGNREDGVDINRFCSDILIRDCKITSGKKYAITIKGGSESIYLKNLVLFGRGDEGVDIDIGNYSDSTMKKSKNIILENVHRFDGKPVTLRVGHASQIFTVNSNVKKLRLQSLGLKIYVYAKALLVKLKLLG